MRAVVLDVPEQWLAERARLGIDRWDEVWEGVLHMVPPPTYFHQKLGSRLLAFLAAPLERRGILVQYETGVFRRTTDGREDYRQPDLVFLEADREAELARERGIEGGPLAVLEIRSPGDETYDKLGFWASLGVREVLVIEPDTRRAEVFQLAAGSYAAVVADEHGRIYASTIGVHFSTSDGPKLRVQLANETVEI
jgi:Uma2 family endonuclease